MTILKHRFEVLPPHPATVVQLKSPHAATVVQLKSPHAATLAPLTWRQPAASAESRSVSFSLQRAILPKQGLKQVLGLDSHKKTPAIVMGTNADPNPKTEISDASKWGSQKLGLNVLSIAMFENVPTDEKDGEPFKCNLRQLCTQLKPTAEPVMLVIACHGNVHWALADSPENEAYALTFLGNEIKQAFAQEHILIDPILLSCCYGATEPIVGGKPFCDSSARILSQKIDKGRSVFGFNGTAVLAGEGIVKCTDGAKTKMLLEENAVGFVNGRVTRSATTVNAVLYHTSEHLKNAFYSGLNAGETFPSYALNKVD